VQLTQALLMQTWPLLQFALVWQLPMMHAPDVVLQMRPSV
jgi:hypothetical protein